MASTTDTPRRGPGRPRTADYPAKVGPIRITQETWDLMARALDESGLTQRQLIEEAIVAKCRKITRRKPTGGNTNGRPGQATQEPGA